MTSRAWPRAILAAAALALALAACGSTASAASDNVQVCRNYMQQRAWVKGLTQPTLASAEQFETDVAVDDSNATPGTRLYRDLTIMETYQSEGKPVRAVSARVLADCAVLGVAQ